MQLASVPEAGPSVCIEDPIPRDPLRATFRASLRQLVTWWSRAQGGADRHGSGRARVPTQRADTEADLPAGTSGSNWREQNAR
eukprot:3143808-Rhodomonas_salina.1